MSNKQSSLQSNSTDYTTSALKGVLGAVPIVGSVLAEVVGSIIPNQRLDRLADFAKKLADKVDDQQAVLLQKRLAEPEGVDILEEALWQSARALSEERRNQIASLVKNGLTQEQVSLIETKKLLLLLSQLNDFEVIILRLRASPRDDKEFCEKYRDLAAPPRLRPSATQEQRDKHAIHESLRQHLVQLGLLRPHYAFVNQNGGLPEFDATNGNFRSSGHKITNLGRLLLRSIDFYPQDHIRK